MIVPFSKKIASSSVKTIVGAPRKNTTRLTFGVRRTARTADPTASIPITPDGGAADARLAEERVRQHLRSWASSSIADGWAGDVPDRGGHDNAV